MSLNQNAQDFGIERRSLRIVKMRGMKFQGGSHDLTLETGGMKVFPRLVASEHHTSFDAQPRTTGTQELDAMLPRRRPVPGHQHAHHRSLGHRQDHHRGELHARALKRGESASYFLFEEGVATLLSRSAQLGLDLGPAMQSGQVKISQIDPAALSPGEFASRVVDAVRQHKSRFVVIDSYNAYMKAMPDQPHMVLHVHELLTYLNQQGVDHARAARTAWPGRRGPQRRGPELLSDVILALRFFENEGRIHSAVTCVKSRVSPHERTIREFQLGPSGLRVGEVLADFEGILSGLPTYHGGTEMLDPPLTGAPSGPRSRTGSSCSRPGARRGGHLPGARGRGHRCAADAVRRRLRRGLRRGRGPRAHHGGGPHRPVRDAAVRTARAAAALVRFPVRGTGRQAPRPVPSRPRPRSTAWATSCCWSGRCMPRHC